MPTEFDKIKNIDGWRDKLDELLQDAREAAKTEDLDPRLEVADRLTEFILHTPAVVPEDPASAEYEDMDRVAKETHDGLLLATIQERVAAVMGKTVELAALRKSLQNRTAANIRAAASIRLENARKLVDATTGAVSAMVALKNDIERAADAGLANADLTALGKELETLIDRLQNLRNTVEVIV